MSRNSNSNGTKFDAQEAYKLKGVTKIPKIGEDFIFLTNGQKYTGAIIAIEREPHNRYVCELYSCDGFFHGQKVLLVTFVIPKMKRLSDLDKWILADMKVKW